MRTALAKNICSFPPGSVLGLRLGVEDPEGKIDPAAANPRSVFQTWACAVWQNCPKWGLLEVALEGAKKSKAANNAKVVVATGSAELEWRSVSVESRLGSDLGDTQGRNIGLAASPA